MNIVKNKFDFLCNTQSDINEHLPTLYKYDTECENIIELGVRDNYLSKIFFLKRFITYSGEYNL
jgi:hypothetical protein